ncbi:HNH endonuclease [Facklamia sp. P12945]
MKIDNNECQVCKAEGKHTPAEMVHHVVHVRDNPMLALSLENLLSL